MSILFADIDKFTTLTEGMEAQDVANILNTIVTAWDKVTHRHGVEKIKTIGDIYMAVCGCPEPNPHHHSTVINCAIDMLKLLLFSFFHSFYLIHSFIHRVVDELNRSLGGKKEIHVRIGINSGSVVAGVIGQTKVMYELLV